MAWILLELLTDIFLFLPCVTGIDKWIPLTPISKDDDVQGEVLVEMSMEPATGSEVASSMHPHHGWPCIVSGATLESYTWHSNRIFFILLIWLDVLGWWLKLLSDFLHGDNQTAPLFEHQATCLCLRPASQNNGGRFLVHSFQLLAYLIGEQ